MRAAETKRLQSAVAIDHVDESGRFDGYAAIFNRVDQGRDVIAPGAFRRSLAERGVATIKLLWQHDPSEPIGAFDEIAEDERGLRVTGRLLLDVQRAREALALMRSGALDGLSIGYKTVAASLDETTGIRTLREIDLWEISLVTFPMQEAARVRTVKADPSAGEPDLAGLLTSLRRAANRLKPDSDVAS
jgi:Escherichia/Staphylococcus phage prohead protease